MTMLPILESLVASSQKFSSVTSSRLFFLSINYIQRYRKHVLLNDTSSHQILLKISRNICTRIIQHKSTHKHIWTRSSATWSGSPTTSDSPTPSNIFQTSWGQQFKKSTKYLQTILEIFSAILYYGDKENLDRVSKFLDINWLWVVAVKDAESPTAPHMEVLKISCLKTFCNLNKWKTTNKITIYFMSPWHCKGPGFSGFLGTQWFPRCHRQVAFFCHKM